MDWSSQVWRGALKFGEVQPGLEGRSQVWRGAAKRGGEQINAGEQPSVESSIKALASKCSRDQPCVERSS